MWKFHLKVYVFKMMLKDLFFAAIKTFLALYEILIENKLIIKKGLSSSHQFSQCLGSIYQISHISVHVKF